MCFMFFGTITSKKCRTQFPLFNNKYIIVFINFTSEVGNFPNPINLVNTIITLGSIIHIIKLC